MKIHRIITILLSAAAITQAAGITVDPSLYAISDIAVNATCGGFSYDNGLLHYWSPTDGGYVTTDVNTGQTTSYGLPAGVNSNGYGDAFGCYDPQSNKFYAATISGWSDAYIYVYDATVGQWVGSCSAINAYGADTWNGELYFSGLNEPWNGGYGQDTYISRYTPDSSHLGGNDLILHDSIIQTVGNSASVAIDNNGNFYYASYNFEGSTLYKWSADQVAGAIDNIAGGAEDNYLTLADAEILTSLDGGANGIAVDDAGNVFITVNGGSNGSQVIMWNSSMGTGTGQLYETIAISSDSWNWLGELDIDGDFLAGDSLYGSFTWGGPITEITYIVPEPTTMALFGIGSLMLKRRRKIN